MSNGSDFDLDFRPRRLVPWLTRDQQRIYGGVRRCGPCYLATFAAEPAAIACPTRGFLIARPRKGRGYEIEDSRNTRKGVESFGKATFRRIPSLREVIALIDASLNRGSEELGPILSSWPETLRQRRLRLPGEWIFFVRSLNYPQLEEWYRRRWAEVLAPG